MLKKSHTAVSFLGLALMAMVAPSLHGAVTMRIDAANNFFYMEGSDSGQADYDPDFGETYSLQFLHELTAQPSSSLIITETPQNLFEQATTLPISGGGMNMIRNNFGTSYVFIDLFATSDITTLTGKGPFETVSYASLPALDQALFEGMIGQTFALTMGTGYSEIAVEAVPEPGAYALLAVAAAGLGAHLLRRKAYPRSDRR